MRFVADDGEHEGRCEGGEARGHFLGAVFGEQAEGFAEGGVRGEGLKEAGGLAGAHEGTVPEFGVGEGAVVLEERNEASAFVVASRAQRAERIFLFSDGVGVADEVDDGHGVMTE